MNDDVASPGAPYRLPMFPLSTVLFPSGRLQLHIFEARYRKMTADCLSGNGELGVVLITRGREVGGGDERVVVGTVGQIDGAMRLPDGRWLLSIGGLRRLRVVEWLPEEPYPLAMVEDIDGRDRRVSTGPDKEPEDPEEPALRLEAALSAVRQARALLSESVPGAPFPAEFETGVHAAIDLDMAGWLLCDAAPLGDLDRLRLLETRGLGERLELVQSLSDEIADDLGRMLAGG
ncbi:MAG: LON peptidase substrate-binding domain-containing protein [Acidimicrobiales bacterium]